MLDGKREERLFVCRKVARYRRLTDGYMSLAQKNPKQKHLIANEKGIENRIERRRNTNKHTKRQDHERLQELQTVWASGSQTGGLSVGLFFFLTLRKVCVQICVW